MYEEITEGSATINVPREKKISKKLDVFYNPVMKFNRDISILLLHQFPKMRICDLLAASGIRSIRMAKELRATSIYANDNDSRAVRLMKQNMRRNNVVFSVTQQDANEFLLSSKGFDYIDIDPYGSPNKFLDNAVKRLSRQGILAVTATDLAPLCGTNPNACQRKYWATPKRDGQMHETGLRILIRKIQLVGAQYDKALIPLLSFYKDHYFRIFFHCQKGKKKVDDVLKEHAMFNEAGPLYGGPLHDVLIVKKMKSFYNKPNKRMKIFQNNPSFFDDAEIGKYLSLFFEEAKHPTSGFYHIHELVKQYNIKKTKQKADIIKELHENGFVATETHFTGMGIRSDASLEEFIALLK